MDAGSVLAGGTQQARTIGPEEVATPTSSPGAATPTSTPTASPGATTPTSTPTSTSASPPRAGMSSPVPTPVEETAAFNLRVMQGSMFPGYEYDIPELILANFSTAGTEIRSITITETSSGAIFDAGYAPTCPGTLTSPDEMDGTAGQSGVFADTVSYRFDGIPAGIMVQLSCRHRL